MIRKRRNRPQPAGDRSHNAANLAPDDPNFDEAAVERELAMTEPDVGGLRDMLEQLLEPDAGLEARTYDAVKKTLLDRETMMTVASLFNLGWRTPKVILMESESPDGS